MNQMTLTQSQKSWHPGLKRSQNKDFGQGFCIPDRRGFSPIVLALFIGSPLFQFVYP